MTLHDGARSSSERVTQKQASTRIENGPYLLHFVGEAQRRCYEEKARRSPDVHIHVCDAGRSTFV